MFQTIRKMISLIAKHLCCNRGEFTPHRFEALINVNTPTEVIKTNDKTICEATYRIERVFGSKDTRQALLKKKLLETAKAPLTPKPLPLYNGNGGSAKKEA